MQFLIYWGVNESGTQVVSILAHKDWTFTPSLDHCIMPNSLPFFRTFPRIPFTSKNNNAIDHLQKWREQLFSLSGARRIPSMPSGPALRSAPSRSSLAERARPPPLDCPPPLALILFYDSVALSSNLDYHQPPAGHGVRSRLLPLI